MTIALPDFGHLPEGTEVSKVDEKGVERHGYVMQNNVASCFVSWTSPRSVAGQTLESPKNLTVTSVNAREETRRSQ